MQLPLLDIELLRIWLLSFLRLFKHVLNDKLGEWVDLRENRGHEADRCIDIYIIIIVHFLNGCLSKLINLCQLYLVSLLSDHIKVLEQVVEIALGCWLLALFHELLLLLFVKLKLVLEFIIEEYSLVRFLISSIFQKLFFWLV